MGAAQPATESPRTFTDETKFLIRVLLELCPDARIAVDDRGDFDLKPSLACRRDAPPPAGARRPFV